MANKGAKKRKEENEKHMRRLQYIVIASNVIYLLLRILLFHSSVSWKHYLGLLITSTAFKLSYDQLNKMAQPSFDESGELIDGGFDMSTGGLCGYIHDVIYITAFVQISSILSDKFWYFYLVIPGFASYKLWQLVLYPFIFQSSKEEDEDVKGKKKKEKKAMKVKYSKMR